MPLTQRTRPYEILIRFHDTGQINSQYQTITEVVGDDGAVISAQVASPVQIPDDNAVVASILSVETVGMLKYISALEARLSVFENR